MSKSRRRSARGCSSAAASSIRRRSRGRALPLGDAVTSAQNFVWVFATVYTLVLFAYIITSWLRLPYSPWLNRIQRFLYDVSEPYLRIFRRILPSMGPLDLSPWIATIVLWILAEAVIRIIGQFH